MRLSQRIAFRTLFSYIALGSVLAWSAQRRLDPEHTIFTIHVGKAGLFSMAGHEHRVAAIINEGVLDDSGEGHISFRIDAHKLIVLPEKDQAEIQTTMQTKVLESDRFPEIHFESTTVQKLAADRWKVEGNLTLHGQTHPVIADVHQTGTHYEGKSTIKQTDFGIQPVSVAGGAVKVKNELVIEFSVQPR